MPARDSHPTPPEDLEQGRSGLDASVARPRLRPGFAALGLVGGAMVCLPLVQLLQYQVAEIEWVRSQRAALDPAADAVAVQRSLLAHGDSAGAVLRGHLQHEPQRRARQAEVDHHVLALSRALSEGHWAPALDEARQLQQDWQVLADRVAQRQIDADLSDEGHRLRVEQVLQVMDMLVLAMAPSPATLAQSSPLPAAALTLSRQAWQWALLSAQGDPATRAAAQRALQQQLQALRQAGRPAAADPAAASTWQASSALTGAIERAALRTERWLALHPATGPGWAGDAQAAAARQVALQALFEVQVAASQQGMQVLDQQMTRLQLQRASSLAALMALAGLSCWLMLGLYRQAQPVQARQRAALPFLADATQPADWAHTQPQLTSLRVSTGPAQAQGMRPTESASEARRVLQRLRQSPPTAPGTSPGPRDAQPSLPPKL